MSSKRKSSRKTSRMLFDNNTSRKSSRKTVRKLSITSIKDPFTVFIKCHKEISENTKKSSKMMNFSLRVLRGFIFNCKPKEQEIFIMSLKNI